MQPRVALYTFGIFTRPYADPVNDSFHLRNEANLAAVEASAGFIARSGYDGDPGPLSWGPHSYPRFYSGSDVHSPSTLSLWTDLESPMAYTYHGIHTEALSHGREWFTKPVLPDSRTAWPPYVLWWVAGDHTPTWREACERLEHLQDHGATARAFNWQTAFDAGGTPYRMDRDSVRRRAKLNSDFG